MPLAYVRWAHLIVVAMAIAMTVLLAGCQERPPKVPGETDILVAEVEILPMKESEPLALSHGSLFERLGERPGSLINTPRTWSQFREAEDRRRIEAFWQQYGYFDVEVSDAATTFDEDGKANITFKVRENVRYNIGEIEIRSPPPEELEALQGLLTFEEGTDEVDLEAHRKVRVDMQEYLRRRGYGHANVYSRFWVDRADKKIDVHYFVDAGPKTFIASVRVEGNERVPAVDIVERSGLTVGDPYTEDLRDRVIRDLMDSGSFAAAFVRVDTDTKFIVPGTAPDTGGELRDEQVDQDGNLIPRKLPPGVNVTIHVVEAPRVNIRLRGTVEVDPARADAYVSSRFFFRDVLGPMGHLVLEGGAGYGYLFGTPSEDPSGFYGDATIRTIHAGALGRLGDLRTTAQYRGDLFPSAYLHTLRTGPGVRTTIDKGLFFDVDLFAMWQQALGFGSFSAAERDELELPSREEAYGPELDAGIVWDWREDPVEPMKGHLLALRSRFMPGDPLATHRYLDLAPDARLFIPIATPVSVGLRASAEWVFLADEEGVPLGARLFGGGAHGFRGYGRQLFSPTLPRCFEELCTEIAVGGTSLVETSAELRLLPPRLPVGGILFADFGGVSGNANPFADGVWLAAGLGARLRLWYLPLAIDVAYRILAESEIQDVDDSPIHVFFRLGEAF
jgi:hypothetical protein